MKIILCCTLCICNSSCTQTSGHVENVNTSNTVADESYDKHITETKDANRNNVTDTIITWYSKDIDSLRGDSLVKIFNRPNVEVIYIELRQDNLHMTAGIRSHLRQFVSDEGTTEIIEKYFVDEGTENWLWLRKENERYLPIAYFKYPVSEDIEWDSQILPASAKLGNKFEEFSDRG